MLLQFPNVLIISSLQQRVLCGQARYPSSATTIRAPLEPEEKPWKWRLQAMWLQSLIECPVLLWVWRRISTFIRQNHYGDSVTTPTRCVRKDTPLFNWPTILPASSQQGHSFINKCLILQVLHYQCPSETICHSVLHTQIIDRHFSLQKVTNQEKGRSGCVM